MSPLISLLELGAREENLLPKHLFPLTRFTIYRHSNFEGIVCLKQNVESQSDKSLLLFNPIMIFLYSFEALTEGRF